MSKRNYNFLILGLVALTLGLHLSGMFTDLYKNHKEVGTIRVIVETGLLFTILIYEIVNARPKIQRICSTVFVMLLVGLVFASMKILVGLLLFEFSLFALVIILFVQALLKKDDRVFSVFCMMLVLSNAISISMRIFHFPGASILLVFDLLVMAGIIFLAVINLVRMRTKVV